MTDRITDCFKKLKTENRAALVTFVTAGDPDFDLAQSLINGLPAAGADIVELGMPFTDPMADGPSIQAAGLRALNNGQTLDKTLHMVESFRLSNPDTPLVLMGYYNPIFSYGVDAFLSKAKAVGVDGLIVVDLPPEHDDELCVPAKAHDIHFIRLITPTTLGSRLDRVLENTSGFLYYVSVAGITGQLAPTPETVEQALKTIRAKTTLPIAVGFGIRTPEQAEQIARFADGVVVGSALVDCITQQPQQPATTVYALTQALAQGIAKARPTGLFAKISSWFS